MFCLNSNTVLQCTEHINDSKSEFKNCLSNPCQNEALVTPQLNQLEHQTPLEKVVFKVICESSHLIVLHDCSGNK